MFAIVTFVLLFQTIAALIGFDYGSRLLNVTTVSLLDVGQCEIPSNPLNVTRKYIQSLQVNEFIKTKAIQCKLEIHRTIYHCGMYSHISVVKNGEHEYIYDISREACRRAHITGTLQFDNYVISGIQINSTTTRPITYAGALDSEARCNGVAYSDPYGNWESVVVQGTLKITL